MVRGQERSLRDKNIMLRRVKGKRSVRSCAITERRRGVPRPTKFSLPSAVISEAKLKFA